VAKDGAVRVRRVVCAVDCGTVVNPDTVQAQIQSAIIFGITAALHGKITLKDGRVEQTNFDTYQMLRMNEAPAIEVHIVQNFEPPGGMGEAGTSAIPPAVANAIFAATGKRLRKLPVDTAAAVNVTPSRNSDRGSADQRTLDITTTLSRCDVSKRKSPAEAGLDSFRFRRIRTTLGESGESGPSPTP
jgi:Molybdopterin cofactor-binding domain